MLVTTIIDMVVAVAMADGFLVECIALIQVTNRLSVIGSRNATSAKNAADIFQCIQERIKDKYEKNWFGGLYKKKTWCP